MAVAPAFDDAIVASARWVRLTGDPQAAEAAIVVGDELQGKGLGTILARRVADTARVDGIRRIHASLLSDNPPAMALRQVISERLSDGGRDGGVREVVAEIAA